jgi:hypothetical protein
MRWKLAAAALLGGMLTLAAPPAPLFAQQAAYWPSEQEQRLKALDAELLSLQRERFQALFFKKDSDEAGRLDKRFKEVQKERRQLRAQLKR